MCSDQHVKYRMRRGFPLTSSLLLDYHVKKYTNKYTIYSTVLLIMDYIDGIIDNDCY